MRKFTTEHTVYTFDELSDEAKQKAIEKEREVQMDMLDGWLPDEMDYQLTELLKKYGMKCEDAKIYYSLGYSQGDGAMFEGTVYWKSYTADIKQSGNYYHYNSKLIDLYSTKTGNYPKNEVYEEFNELYVQLCKELEKAGYDAIENTTTDEALAENIKDNNYEFYEDGRMA